MNVHNAWKQHEADAASRVELTRALRLCLDALDRARDFEFTGAREVAEHCRRTLARHEPDLASHLLPTEPRT